MATARNAVTNAGSAGFEVPPTAGLPLSWRDLRSASGQHLAPALANLLGIRHAQLECSGTAALVVALTTLQRNSPRRQVIVPAFTCPLVALAVAHCGLELVLCDMAENSLDMCPEQLFQLCGEMTLAIIPTHLAGRVADVEYALAQARRVGAHVIEDAAQAVGAQWRQQSVGLRGDIGFFSLAAGKGLTLFEGGLLVTADPHMAQALAEVSAEIIPARPLFELRRCIELLGYLLFYRPRGLALVYGRPLRQALQQGDLVDAVGDLFPRQIPLHRVSRWRQAIGLNALARLPAFLHSQREQALRRIRQLSAIAGVSVFVDTPEQQGNWPFLLLTLPSEALRDAAMAQLWTQGLGVSRLFIHALNDYDYLADIVPATDTPHARDLAARSLSISNSLWLNDDRFEAICRVLASVLKAV